MKARTDLNPQFFETKYLYKIENDKQEAMDLLKKFSETFKPWHMRDGNHGLFVITAGIWFFIFIIKILGLLKLQDDVEIGPFLLIPIILTIITLRSMASPEKKEDIETYDKIKHICSILNVNFDVPYPKHISDMKFFRQDIRGLGTKLDDAISSIYKQINDCFLEQKEVHRKYLDN